VEGDDTNGEDDDCIWEERRLNTVEEQKFRRILWIKIRDGIEDEKGKVDVWNEEERIESVISILFEILFSFSNSPCLALSLER
jgi:hypothetical protein